MTRRFTSMLLVLVLAIAACGGDDSSEEPLQFGEGEIPSTFPDDFPLPAGTVIGTTLIDRTNHKSEASLRIPADLETTVRYFNLALVEQGYVVESSSGSAAEWNIRFSRGELDGFINISGSTGLALAVVTLNVS